MYLQKPLRFGKFPLFIEMIQLLDNHVVAQLVLKLVDN